MVCLNFLSRCVHCIERHKMLDFLVHFLLFNTYLKKRIDNFVLVPSITILLKLQSKILVEKSYKATKN